MNCNCIRKIEQNALEMRRKKFPERTYDDINQFGSDGFQHVSVSLGPEGGTFVYFPFKLSYTFQKTNKETSSPKKETINLYPSFCPFYGIDLNKKKDAEPIPENDGDQKTSS